MRTSIGARLADDNEDWIVPFIERTGANRSKILNEALRIAKSTLLERLENRDVLFPHGETDRAVQSDVIQPPQPRKVDRANQDPQRAANS